MSQAAVAAARKAETPVKTGRPQDIILSYLRAHAGQIRPLLPSHMTMERLEYTMLVALREDPELYSCARSEAALESFVQAACQAAITGLEPGRALDLAYITPLKNKQYQVIGAKYETTYKGDLQLLYRNKSIRNIFAEVVHEKDEFDIELGAEPKVRHKPTLQGEPGEIIAAYSVVKLANGEVQIEFMRRSELDLAQSKSRRRNKSSGPWAEWHGEMSKKSVLRRHMKRLPLTTDVLRLVSQDQGSEYSHSVESALGAVATESISMEVHELGIKANDEVTNLPDERQVPIQPRVEPPKNEKPNSLSPGTVTPAQVKLLEHKFWEKGIENDDVVAFLKEQTGKDVIEKLTVDEYRGVLKAVAARS